MLNRYLVSVVHIEMQRSEDSSFTTWGEVHVEGPVIPCLLMGHVSSCLGDISKGARVDEISLIHVFDTSMCARFVNLSGQPSKLKLGTQRTSSTRIPSVTLSILMRRSPNLRGSHPQVPQPRSNHSTQAKDRRLTVLPVCKTLPPLYRVALLTNETPV